VVALVLCNNKLSKEVIRLHLCGYVFHWIVGAVLMFYGNEVYVMMVCNLLY